MSAALTNKFNLPQTLVNLARRDPYTRGASKMSVTELINSPRIRVLRAKHGHLVTEDIADRFWALMGRLLHEIVEQGADEEHLAEERLFAAIQGITISGGVDLQAASRDVDGNIIAVAISDYKFTTAWAVMNPKDEWEKQQNCYAFLVEKVKGVPVTGLSINAILRDWNRKEAKRNPDYPQAPMVVVPLNLWPAEERKRYVEERVRLHLDAERADQWEEELPPCSDEERWFRPGKLAVVKDGRQRALKLFEVNEREAADAYAAENKARVEARPGEHVRCQEFCTVAQWCSQWKNICEESSHED